MIFPNIFETPRKIVKIQKAKNERNLPQNWCQNLAWLEGS